MRQVLFTGFRSAGEENNSSFRDSIKKICTA